MATTKKTYGGKPAASGSSSDPNLPSGFVSMLSPTKTIKSTSKLGNQKIKIKKKFSDVEIGNGIVGRDADLEGFGDTLEKVKKDGVEVQPGAMRKHKMIKQLSGKFSKEDLKDEAMEMHKKKMAAAAAGDGTTTLKMSLHSKSSLHSTGSGGKRPKVNIFAMIDDAIEDGATEEAKERLAREKAMTSAPIPKKKIKVKSKSIPVKRATQPPVPKEPKAEPVSLPPTVEEGKKEVADDEPSPMSTTMTSRSSALLSKVDKAIESEPAAAGVPSMFGSSVMNKKSTPKKSTSMPPWKARLKAQEKTSKEPETAKDDSAIPVAGPAPAPAPVPAPIVEPPKSPTPPPNKPTSAKKLDTKSSSPVPSPTPTPRTPIKSPKLVQKLEAKLSPAKSPVRSPRSPMKPSSFKKAIPAPVNPPVFQSKSEPRRDDDSTSVSDPESDDDSSDDDGDNTPLPVKAALASSVSTFKEEGVNAPDSPHSPSSPSTSNGDLTALLTAGMSTTRRGDVAMDHLRQELEETQKKIENAGLETKIQLADMKKELAMEKESLRLKFMKDIHAHKKVNDKQGKEHQKLVDQEQQAIDEIRAANQKLRATLEKLPKQIAEVTASNKSLEKANEDIAGHFDELAKFAKKLQADQDRLKESSTKCKDDYLPRYRQELWERQQFLSAETKIKNLYRDTMIKITKKVDKTNQADLIEEIATMVLETEGEVNPKFDPKLLFAGDDKSDGGSNSDSDDSSSSDSDSASDSDSD